MARDAYGARFLLVAPFSAPGRPADPDHWYGPESVVMRAAALARQFGAASEELVLIATEAAGATGATEAAGTGSGEYVAGPAGRRVFCATCRESFDAVATLGGIVTCPGCATALIMDHRFSRPHAAYFGWPARLDLHR
jgi:hypothetical protein